MSMRDLAGYPGATRGSAAPIRPAALAAGLGWSVRHLERRFEQQVGVPPRSVAQIARLQRALHLQEQGLSWALVATMAGFYDQPHLDRTFRVMIGCTPAQFRADRAMTAPEVPVDRAPGQITSVVLSG
jgi:transcriptional regulator GlxA family with amidase domain